MNLKENLKKIRKDNNLSQEDLAEKLGVSRQSVSKWESGQAYPEMDKVIQICNLFNLNIDDLLNQNIKEVENNNKSKVNINKYIDDFLDFITKTIKMFSSMKFKDKLICLFEQCVVIGMIALIFLCVGAVLLGIVDNILCLLPESISYALCNILSSIYLFISVILTIIILIHVFKTRYLNYYIIVDADEENNELVDETRVVENKNIDYKFIEEKKEKIIIRDPKHSEYKFLNGILKCLLFVVKVLDAFIGLFFCFTFVVFIIAFVLSFLIVKSGLLFFGILLIVISCIIINYIILNISYNFIINKKVKKVLIGMLILLSLVLFGTGSGLSLVSIKDFKLLETPNSNNIVTSERIIEMSDDLIIEVEDNNIKIIESDNSDLRFVIKNIKGCKTKFYEGDMDIIYYYNVCDFSPELFKGFVDSINNKEILDYSYNEVELYTNAKNIETLKTNKRKFYNYDEEY